jgi:ATP-dependent Clp protease adapter protein ClpS
MSQQTIVVPRPEDIEELGSGAGEWMVIVFDNPINTWDQVIRILQRATGCTLEEAEMETWEVHHLGKSVVHHADKEECERVAAIIRTIGIDVAVDQV